MPAFASALDAALHYSSILGWHVFPCRANKTPLTVNGHIDATTDKDQIVAWWRKWPTAQVGVACGASGLCVIDLDYDSGRKLDGPSFFARLEAEHGPNWCDLAASTPRGGRHLIYSMPSPPVGNRANAIPASGIDVRADGGYIVAPSPASPGREWNLGEDWIDEPSETLTAPPEWIDREILGVRRNGAVRGRTNGVAGSAPPTALPVEQVESIKAALEFIDSDPRDEWIRVGMALKSTGAGEHAYSIWREWSTTSAKFDEKVQRQQWASLKEFFRDGSEVTLGTLFHMAQQGGYDGRTVDDELSDLFAGEQHDAEPATVAIGTVDDDLRAELPAGLLDGGDLIAGTVRWIVASAPVEQPELALGAVLATLGAVVGRKVETPSGVRTNLYALNVADTGAGKSWPQTAATELLRAAGLSDYIGPGEWKSDTGLRKAVEAKLSHAAIIDEFGDHLAAIANPRAGSWQRGIATALKQLTSIANASWLPPAFADTKTNPPIEIIEPNLCLIGSTLPEKLAKAVTTEAVADGLLNRCLLFVGRPKPRLGALPDDERAKVPPPADLVTRWKALDEAQKPPEGALTHRGGCARRLTLSADAALQRHAARLAVQSRVDAMPAEVRPLWGRFDEHLLRVALIRTVARDPSATTVEAEAIDWANNLVCWSLGNMQRLVVDHVSDSEHESGWKRVLRMIAASGSNGLTGTEVSKKTGWLRSIERKDIMVHLIEAELIRSEQSEGASGRKRVTRYWAIG